MRPKKTALSWSLLLVLLLLCVSSSLLTSLRSNAKSLPLPQGSEAPSLQTQILSPKAENVKTRTAEPLADMVEKIYPGVVNISSTTIIHYQSYAMDEFLRLYGIPQERKQTSLGAGFIIDQQGLLLTNNHVVDQASEVIATLTDGRRFRARVIGKDDKFDLALLQIRDKEGKIPNNLTPISLGDSSGVRIAQEVIAVGNPLGLENTVTKGIISAKNRAMGVGPLDNYLQTDASINPGNSGGPLINRDGEAIGINTFIRSETGQSIGLGFAIPINEVKKVIPDLKKYGRVPRPWLGVLGVPITPQLEEYYDLPSSQGVLIYKKVADAPADIAGISVGDIVVSVGGTQTTKPNDIEKALARLKPNDSTVIQIIRSSKSRDIKVQLSELPSLVHLPRGII